jgi:hypothetical protein
MTTTTVEFNDASEKFSVDPGQNYLILGHIQAYANDKLRNKGYLFVNDILEMLGLPETRAGQTHGWVMPRRGNPVVIDFGLADTVITTAGPITLQLNTAGDILDKIVWVKR